MGLKSPLGHLLATGFTSLNFSFPVSFSKDECQGLLRAGHTGALSWSGFRLCSPPSRGFLPGLPPEGASLTDRARPGFWHPDQHLEATTERGPAALRQLPLCRGSSALFNHRLTAQRPPARQAGQTRPVGRREAGTFVEVQRL